MDLNEMAKISKEEFQEQLQEWIEKTSVAKTIQSKLRKDLIENFNRTTLGRQIAMQHEQQQQLVLSPLVYGLNTLVSEFLYRENCHFTLSVFSTETAYKNALPNFEQSENFRFDNVQLQEVLEAIGMANMSDLSNEITHEYLTKESKLTMSLLHIILRRLIDHRNKTKPKEPAPAVHPVTVNTKKIKSLVKTMSKTNETDKKYFKHLNQCLINLTQQVSEIKQRIETTKEKPSNGNCSEKINQFSKSIDQINENMLNLSKSNRKSKKLVAVIASITNLTNEIGKCGESFEKLAKEMHQEKETFSKTVETKSNESKEPKNYSQFLEQLHCTKYGKEFIEKYQKDQRELFEKESAKLQQIYDEKLETNRAILKLHYKQKMLEKCRNLFGQSNMSQTNQDYLNSIIETRLKSLENQRTQYNTTPIATKTKPTTVENNQNDYEKQIPKLTQHRAFDLNIFPFEPVQQEIIENNEEHHSDHIVQYAKNRLKQLENESEQLDLSFKKYLKKQDDEKKELNKSVIKIWENYNFGKQILNQTPTISGAPQTFNRNDAKQKFLLNMNTNLNRTNVHSDNIFPINVAVNTENPDLLPENNFENPFKMITVEDILLTKPNAHNFNEKVHSQKRVTNQQLKLKSRVEATPIQVTKEVQEIPENNEMIENTLSQASKLKAKSNKVEKPRTPIPDENENQNIKVLENKISEIKITKPSDSLNKTYSQTSINENKNLEENPLIQKTNSKVNLPKEDADNQNLKTVALSSQLKEPIKSVNLKPTTQALGTSENDVSEDEIINNNNETSIGEKSTSSDDFWQ